MKTALLLLLTHAAFAGVVFTTDFESGVPSEISGTGALESTGSTPAIAGLGNNFFRNAGGLGEDTFLTLAGLAPHTSVTLTLTFIAADSWDGGGAIAHSCCQPDLLRISADGVDVYLESFRNVFTPTALTTDANAVNIGFGSYVTNGNWSDSIWQISFSFAHTGSSLELAFAPEGAGWQAGNDESIGLDNITITTNASTVIPEPSTYAFVGSALALLAAMRLPRRS